MWGNSWESWQTAWNGHISSLCIQVAPNQVEGGMTMMILLSNLNQVAIEVMGATVASENAPNEAANAVANASGIGDPLALGLWSFAVLAIAGIWFLLARKPYPKRRYTRTLGRGPFSRFRDVVVNSRISPFAP